MRSRARWEDAFKIQKRHLGKHLSDIDSNLSFDSFSLYLEDLEDSRSNRGLGRFLSRNVLDQIKELTGAIAYTFTDILAIIAEMITDLTDQLPLFEQYRSLFPTAYELEEPILELYFNYVGFCIDVVTFLRSKRWKANLRRQPIMNGIPFDRNFRFQGREAVLDDLHKVLRPNDGVVGKSGQKSCVIHGIGGVGKTQVALEYTYRYREDYSRIFWVRAETGVELSTSFASFARSLVPDSAVFYQLTNVKQVRDWMVQNDRWLLIFDNADAVDLDLSLYWPPSCHGEIIVTTQRRDFRHWAVNDIHLDTFDEDVGAQLILDIIDDTSQTHSKETIETARNISIELGGLPRLISHIAGYIEGTKASLNAILSSLQQPSAFKRIWAFDSTTSTNFQYNHSMAKVWELALDALQPEALRMLHLMAMLNADEVNEDLLFGDWQDSDLDFLSEYRCFEFNELRKSLIDRHLVTATMDTNSTKLSMHRVLEKHLLQQIDDAGADELGLVFKRAVVMIRLQFPQADELQTPNSMAWVECEKCLPHVMSLRTIYQQWSPKVKPTYDFATLLADTATNYMWERGLTSEALEILTTGEQVCNDLSQLEDIKPVYADICAIAGSVHEENGLSGRAAALEACEKALKLRQERVRALEDNGQTDTVNGELQLANAWNDVGVVKLSYGDFEAALSCFLESQNLKQRHKTEQEMPWHYGELYKNLALTKLYQGDIIEAEEDARRSCDLCSSGRSKKDASVQTARSILGIVLMNVKKTEKALELLKGVYRARKDLLGETNFHTKDSLYLVAELYRFRGKMDKAESNLRLALNQCEFSWGDESVARARYHLALVINTIPDKLNTERELEAKALVDKARETRKRVAPSYKDVLSPEEEFQCFEFMNSITAGRWIGQSR
ncbi:hypothetical protein E0Z10_g5367 [Xylaria hypoxylon]|uniref:DUF7779 domain-containing protein n=1 Tax=Xylaria hypoxylon TaxID=37992 RepID=A0A4Z0YTQ8_9PEZI|nr:hypothetical protein E0Z10_g5367 [Xylaria hypoxylon]